MEMCVSFDQGRMDCPFVYSNISSHPDLRKCLQVSGNLLRAVTEGSPSTLSLEQYSHSSTISSRYSIVVDELLSCTSALDMQCMRICGYFLIFSTVTPYLSVLLR